MTGRWTLWEVRDVSGDPRDVRKDWGTFGEVLVGSGDPWGNPGGVG